MLIFLVVLLSLASGSAFRYGFGRFPPPVRRRSALKSSLSSPKCNNIDLVVLDDMMRCLALQQIQTPVNSTVYPAINNSPYLIAKYPDPLNRTVQNILGGLPDVTDIEYLNSLPSDDPRRHLLATIPDPGPERRAELMENLQAIDAERRRAGKKKSTYSLFQKLSREGIDADLVRTLEKAADEETLRRERREFVEYKKKGWNSVFNTEELTKYVHKCFEKSETGLVCKHPSLPVWFPYYKKGQPPTNYSLSELTDMRTKKIVKRKISNIVFSEVIYPVIAESPIVAAQYPNPADRTPFKLLSGLANTVSIEYMQSLEPHDPRRLFLESLKPLSKKRRIEVEMNVLLVDRAVTELVQYEPGRFSLRQTMFQVVRDALEENYLSTLIAAKHSEQHRRYAKNNGAEGTDPENDEYRKHLADATAYFAKKDAPGAC